MGSVPAFCRGGGVSCLTPVLVLCSLRGSVTQEGENQGGLSRCFTVLEQFWQPPYFSPVNCAHKNAVGMQTLQQYRCIHGKKTKNQKGPEAY